MGPIFYCATNSVIAKQQEAAFVSTINNGQHIFTHLISMHSVTCIHCMHVTLFMLINSHEQCNMHTVPVGPVPVKLVPVQSLKYIESGSTQ